MKLEKAIEILTAYIKENTYIPNRNIETATKLGLEALRTIETLRTQEFYPACYLLPGETED